MLCCAAWPDYWIRQDATQNVVLLELFPILVALELWGESFANRQILVETDNKGVLFFAVNCLSSRSLWVIKSVASDSVFMPQTQYLAKS